MAQQTHAPERQQSAAHRSPHLPVSIIGTGSYLPTEVLANEPLSEVLGVPPDWIEERTGIRERRVAAPTQATSDLATEAAARALADAGMRPEDVDLLLVATSSPDMPMPATACLVAANLGLRSVPAFDVDAACAGFLYALAVARCMMSSDPDLGNALVVGADVYSRMLDYDDRRTASLFGDGAGAVVLGQRDTGAPLHEVRLGADGAKAGYVHIPAGGSRRPASVATADAGGHFLKMDGRAVREFALDMFERMLAVALADARVAVDDLVALVPHQANVRLLEQCARRVGLRPDQLAITGDVYGNTGAASVPITLDTAIREDRLRRRGPVLLMAIGAGMTWGHAVVSWHGSPGPERRAGHGATRTEAPV